MKQQLHVIHINQSKKVQKRKTDKSDRHTIDQVLDQRTRNFVFQLTEASQLNSLESVINSGKEANVYLSHSPVNGNLTVAVKIFSTSKMSFKNRQIYIQNDRRFQSVSASCSNSRRLVHLWAEKEFRNCKRIFECNLIHFAKPILVNENIIIQELIGQGNNAAPRLVDVAKYLSISRLTKCYYSIMRMMRDLYQICKLVHGDLSEYNLLFNQNKVYLIDVGQSTDVDSEVALTLLRIDIRNINSFFAKLQLSTISNSDFLAFIVSNGVPDFDNTIDENLIDCCGPTPVSQGVVSWIRTLHKTAQNRDFESIKQDDAFIETRIFQNLKETGEFCEDKSRLENLGVHVYEENVEVKYKESKYTRNDMLVEGAEESFEGDEELSETEKLIVDMNSLKRKNFTKEEWKRISDKLKNIRTEKRGTKKPKVQKRREKSRAAKKRGN
ncbi:putative RIO kinase 1 [Spironucleus salmonicida]|uniref:non-specific serine/threonine protein kinase n=1 Tax=Spironucleus salmonicida TaxID=348837 RepID=V6LYN6_9EUKA|nr:putative RIO kinase 1 [Spironucleus salmonicida]|eukprot:EST45939.1 RIO kinase 1, putative [Spironucleus salmonicida]